MARFSLRLTRLQVGTDGAIVAMVLVLFACRAILASAIVPPWQGPDEPTHFALAWELSVPAAAVKTAEIVRLPDRSNAINVVAREVQRQVLESMARHQWWEPYGASPPEPLPTFFVEAGAMSAGSLAQPLYYSLGALFIPSGEAPDVEDAYRRLRALSIALALTTLALGWAGTRLLFGPSIAAGALAIGALHPQFLLTAISVNPDALANVCGAFIWWQCARAIANRHRASSLILVVVAALTALLIKRSALPLALLALVTAGWLFAWFQSGATRRAMTAGAAAVGAIALVALLSLGIEPRLASIWRSAFIVLRPLSLTALAALPEYVLGAVDYSWLVAGWHRFPAPAEWYWMMRAITAVGAAGAVLALIRSRGGVRRRLLLAWVFLSVQVLAVIGPGFWSLAAPQGRFLFVMFAPMTTLLWIGVREMIPPRWHWHGGVGFLTLLAMMDVAGFATVLFPAYLPYILRVQ